MNPSLPSSLRSVGFRWLLLYRICTLLSYQIVAVTVGWHIYEVTHNTLSLGLVGLAEVIPYFCVAPFAGHLVDHLPRRKMGAAAAPCWPSMPAYWPWWPATLPCTPRALGPSIWRWPWAVSAVRCSALSITLCSRARPATRPLATGASLGSVVFQADWYWGQPWVACWWASENPCRMQWGQVLH